ncbi:MAG: ion transporter [Planctomycetaceae bacterium]|nr:ion transporter [Planctomycetaceae bacterium]MCP4480106.1 ion transporter [Planctomycetaceae bacterium]MCP4777509.1 ion transporter [Planctomycetaceae bacterium]
MSHKNREEQTVQEKMHEIIFGAHTTQGWLFDMALLVVIVLSVISNSLETVAGFEDRWKGALFWASWVFTGLFTVEYALRIYCVKKPWRFIFSFWGIVDLLAILPEYLLFLFFSAGGHSSAFSAIRSLRLLRVFRILNLSWFQREGEDLGNAIWRARGKIVVFIMVVLIIVTIAGTIMYDVESTFDPDSKFTSIPMGIYWAIVTMTTVGFGDIVPKTTGGQFISAILILVGYSLIIVPTGFVSAEVLDRKRRRVISTVACPSCLTEDHDDDALFCKYCGGEM